MNRYRRILVIILYSITTHVLAIDTSKEESVCAEIGFKKGSENFGNCVLKLLDKNNSKNFTDKSINQESTTMNQRALEQAERALEETRRIRAQLERDKISDKREQQEKARRDSQQKQFKDMMDTQKQIFKDAEKRRCESWGDRCD